MHLLFSFFRACANPSRGGEGLLRRSDAELHRPLGVDGRKRNGLHCAFRRADRLLYLFNLQAWKPSEPNNASDHCVQVSTTLGPMNGRWSVVACDTQRPALCLRDISTFIGDEDEDEWIHRSQCAKCNSCCPACRACNSCCWGR